MDIVQPTPALVLVLGVASVVASAMFYRLHLSACHVAGVGVWGFASLSVGVAVIVDALRLIDDPQLASLFYNICLCLGQILFLIGTAQFVRHPIRRYALILLVSAVVALAVAFTLVWPDAIKRVFSLSLLQTGIVGTAAWLLWKHRESYAPYSYGLAAAIVLAQALTVLIQALLVITTPPITTHTALQLPLASLAIWLNAILNVLLGNWILFLLVMLRLMDELTNQASKDMLTGLLNRRGIRSHIDAVIRPNCSGQSLAVLLLDIDYFKKINDKHGHGIGDKVLIIMADVLRAVANSSVTPCRWGGEEFCIIVDSHSNDSLIKLADRVRLQFASMTRSSPDLSSGVTVSIGISTLAVDEEFEFSKLVKLADAQLYLAKSLGRNRVCSTANEEIRTSFAL